MQENNDLKFIQDKHDDELALLDFRIHELQAANENLMMENESLKKDKEKNDDEWFREIYKNLSSNAKKEIKNAYALVAPQLEKGTTLRLRKNLGINFSNALPEQEEDMTDLKRKVVEFAEKNTIYSIKITF